MSRTPIDMSAETATPTGSDIITFFDVSDDNKPKKATLDTLIDASGTLASLTVTTLTNTTLNSVNGDFGSSGTAGTVDIFPTTASKGKLQLTCTDQTGNTTVTVTAGAMGQATTVTLPDPGASTANITTDKGVGGTVGARCTSQFDATSGTTGTTLTNVTGMSVNVIAAGTYAVNVYVAGTSTTNSGMKLALGGTATWTSVNASCNYSTASAMTCGTNSTATPGTAIGGTTAAIIRGHIQATIVVNAAGTLTLMAAQNASHGDTTSVYVNSYITATRIA